MTLHVANGESLASSLRRTSLESVVLSWDDVLHVGPLVFDAADSRRARAAFLAERGWGEAAAIESELERRDDLLTRAAHVVAWFEHDLFDQLQLLQVLALVPDTAQVELVRADDFLGPLGPDELEALWPSRRPVSVEARHQARQAWLAVTEGNLEQDVPELPHLASALRRLAEEREAPSRTKRQLLTLLADGPRTPLQLFVANQKLEEAAFLGDTWCFLFLWELARDGLVRGPLPSPPPLGDREAFLAVTLELTAAGRKLV